MSPDQRYTGVIRHKKTDAHESAGIGFSRFICIANPDLSRVECAHIQGIRAVDVVAYLKAMITQKMGALGSPEG